MRIVLAKYRTRLLRLRRRAAEHRAAVRLVRCATTDDINAALEVVYCRHNVPVDFPRGSHKKGQWMPGEIKMMEQILAMAEKHDERVHRIAGYTPSADDDWAAHQINKDGAPGGMGERKGLFTK